MLNPTIEEEDEAEVEELRVEVEVEVEVEADVDDETLVDDETVKSEVDSVLDGVGGGWDGLKRKRTVRRVVIKSRAFL